MNHPSGIELSSIPGDHVLDDRDQCDGDAVGCLTSIALHVAAFRRGNVDTWARQAVRLLNAWYVAERIPRVAEYDKRAGEIVTRNSMV